MLFQYPVHACITQVLVEEFVHNSKGSLSWVLLFDSLGFQFLIFGQKFSLFHSVFPASVSPLGQAVGDERLKEQWGLSHSLGTITPLLRRERFPPFRVLGTYLTLAVVATKLLGVWGLREEGKLKMKERQKMGKFLLCCWALGNSILMEPFTLMPVSRCWALLNSDSETVEGSIC